MRQIGLGPACNNACVFCAQGELRTSKGSDEALVLAQLETIARGDVVAFLGGEPTIHEGLPSWLRLAHERGASRVILQTNGRRLAYPSYVKALHEACPVLSLDASLHGSTEAMHDYHTGVSGSFKQSALGLRNARAEGVPAYVTTVVTRSNFRHLVEILRVIAALGVRGQQISVAQPLGRALREVDRVAPAMELVKPQVIRAVAEARRLRIALRVGEQLSDPDLRDRFAGLGEVEPAALPPAPPSAVTAASNGKVALRLLTKAAPGVGERRVPDRRTGENLREIFPDLFATRPADKASFSPLCAEDIQRLAAEEARRRASEGDS